MKKVVPYLTYLGTRPPTLDEWNKYELHHRARLAIRGIEIGEFRMLVKQVKKGRLTIEEAAEDAAMSVEEFRNVTDDMLKEG